MRSLFLFLFAIVCIASVTAGNIDSSSQQTVEAFVKAFNKHNVEEMRKPVADDVEWFSVMGGVHNELIKCAWYFPAEQVERNEET